MNDHGGRRLTAAEEFRGAGGRKWNITQNSAVTEDNKEDAGTTGDNDEDCSGVLTESLSPADCHQSSEVRLNNDREHIEIGDNSRTGTENSRFTPHPALAVGSVVANEPVLSLCDPPRAAAQPVEPTVVTPLRPLTSTLVVPPPVQLSNVLLDPAVNLLFSRMRKELTVNKEKLDQIQNELVSYKFTPDTNTGRKLMSKCRQLIQENQDLGTQISSGRVAQLEAELALQKKYSEQLKGSQDELNEFIVELDEEVNALQATIVGLQDELKEARGVAQTDRCYIQRLEELLKSNGIVLSGEQPPVDTVATATEEPQTALVEKDLEAPVEETGADKEDEIAASPRRSKRKLNSPPTGDAEEGNKSKRR